MQLKRQKVAADDMYIPVKKFTKGIVHLCNCHSVCTDVA